MFTRILQIKAYSRLCPKANVEAITFARQPSDHSFNQSTAHNKYHIDNKHSNNNNKQIVNRPVIYNQDNTQSVNMSTQSQQSLNKVEIDSSNSKGKLPIYISNIQHSGKKAAVVMIQEWWGINEQIKRQAIQWYVTAGFDVVVPDLYRGKVTDDQEEAGHLMNQLDFPGAVQDIQASVDYLKSQGYQSIGVTGVCMGGALTIASAVKVTSITAAACFYGIPDNQYFPHSQVKVPIQLHFGNSDEMKGFSDPESANELEDRLKSGNVKYEFYRYDGAGHAFTNDTHHGNTTEKQASVTAHKRVIEFFNKQLK